MGIGGSTLYSLALMAAHGLLDLASRILPALRRTAGSIFDGASLWEASLLGRLDALDPRPFSDLRNNPPDNS